MGKVNPIYGSDIPYHVCGIYKFTAPNGKIYIGQSLDIRRRLHSHRCNAHTSKQLIGRAIQKYGFENFKIEVLIYFKPTKDKKYNKELLNKFEKSCIKKYKSNLKEIGYNVSEGGDGSIMSEETKKKISILKTGFRHTEECKARIRANTKHSEEYKERLRRERTGVRLPESTRLKIQICNAKKRKPIDQYDKDGRFIKSFESITDACQELDCLMSGIAKTLNGGRKRYKDFIWVYKGQPVILQKHIYEENRIRVAQYDLNMNFIIEHESLVKASQYVGCHETQIGLCVRGKKQSVKGYIFKRIVND